MILPWSRVLNESWQAAKFTGYFPWSCCLLFFGKKDPKKPKFNDVCVLFKHSCYILLQNAGIYAFLKAQISTFFLSSNLCFWPPQFAHVAQVFFSCSYSKAFAIYLKPYWKPCLMWVQYCVNLGHFIITEFCWCCGISDRLHVSSWKGQRLQGGALWFYSTACTKALLEMYPHIYLSFV